MNKPNNQSNGGCRHNAAELQAVDFALQETVLYLDAYPDHVQALDYYHKLVELRRELMEHYEKNCGPVTVYGNVSRTSWDWIKGPWPWEPEANER